MMIVAIVLALGFTILISLALYLCLIIASAVVMWPSWSYRFLVIAMAFAFIFLGSKSASGSLRTYDGLQQLVEATDGLQSILGEVANRQANLTLSAATLKRASCAPPVGAEGYLRQKPLRFATQLAKKHGIFNHKFLPSPFPSPKCLQLG
jgi:hypothetical protein